MDKPSPPDWMPLDAHPAFNRIVDNLWRRGEWRHEYSGPAEHASMSCINYARLVQRAAPADEIEEQRTIARGLLADMGWLPENRAHLGLIDANGHDVDLVEICRPLEN